MDREHIGSAPPARLRVEVRTVGASELLAPVGELDHHTAELLRSPWTTRSKRAARGWSSTAPVWSSATRPG